MSYRPKLSDEIIEVVDEFRKDTDQSFSGRNKAIEYLVKKGIEFEERQSSEELTQGQRDEVKKLIEKFKSTD